MTDQPGRTDKVAPLHCAADIDRHFRKDIRSIQQEYAIALDGLAHIVQPGLRASQSSGGWSGLGDQGSATQTAD